MAQSPPTTRYSELQENLRVYGDQRKVYINYLAHRTMVLLLIIMAISLCFVVASVIVSIGCAIAGLTVPLIIGCFMPLFAEYMIGSFLLVGVIIFIEDKIWHHT